MVHLDMPTASRRHRLQRRAAQLASSPSVRAAVVLVGVLGISAVAVAILGPRRARPEVFEPLRDAVEPHDEKAWADTKAIRDQFTALLQHVSPPGRKELARHFQSWLGNFRTG